MKSLLNWYRASNHTQWISAIGWSILILTLCGIPGDNLPPMNWGALLSLDKFLHALVFVFFVLLWCFPMRYLYGTKGPWIATLLGVSFGILIEFLQYAVFSRRSAEWLDMVADTVGCLIGLGIWQLVHILRPQKDKVIYS